MNHTTKTQETEDSVGPVDRRIDRRMVLQGGALLATAAAGGTFAPVVKASTQAKALLSSDGPIITDVVLTGSDLTITGTNLGTQLGELCVVAKDDLGNIALARATSVSPNQVLGTIVAVPPAMTEGRVIIMLGEGTDALPTTVPAGFVVTEPTLIWTTEEEISATSSQTISLAGAIQERHLKMTVTNHWGVITNGQVLVDITSAGPDCFVGDQIKFVSDMQLSNGEWLRFDIQGPLDVASDRRLDLCLSDYCNFVKQAISDFTGGDMELVCTTQGTFPTVQFLMQAVIDHRVSPPIVHTFVSGSALIQIRNP